MKITSPNWASKPPYSEVKIVTNEIGSAIKHDGDIWFAFDFGAKGNFAVTTFRCAARKIFLLDIYYTSEGREAFRVEREKLSLIKKLRRLFA
jgi:hypothetical protein